MCTMESLFNLTLRNDQHDLNYCQKYGLPVPLKDLKLIFLNHACDKLVQLNGFVSWNLIKQIDEHLNGC